MTVEDGLREALRRRAGAVVPAEPQWSHVARRIARPPRRRWLRTFVPATAVLVAIVATLLVVVDRDDETSRPVRTAGGPAVASPPPTVAITAPAPPATIPPPAEPDALGPAGGPVPAGFRPFSVTWVSTSRGWVLGTAPCASPPCTSLLRTIDGGASWAGVPAPRSEDVRQVRFADERNGWAFGPELWTTHDGGATWRRLESPAGPTTSLEAAGSMVYAVVGTPIAHVFGTDVKIDGWRQVGSDEVAPSAPLALQGGAGYTLGSDRAVLALSAGALERRGMPCPNGGGGSLSIVGSDLLSLCIGGAAAGSTGKSLVVSVDGGRTWQPAGTPPFGGSGPSMAAASRSTIVVGAGGGTSLIYRSEDGGATWTTVYQDSSFGGSGFVDLGFTTAARGVAVVGGAMTGSRLLLTTDGGRTWSPVTFGP